MPEKSLPQDPPELRAEDTEIPVPWESEEELDEILDQLFPEITYK